MKELLLASATIGLIVAILALGMEVGSRQTEARMGKPIILTKACPQPVVAKPIPRVECLRMCYARERMERIVQR